LEVLMSTSIVPRWYQSEAVEAAFRGLETKPGNPVIELPTGAGKSVVIAMICQRVAGEYGGRVLVLAHVKELLEQAADKLRQLCDGITVSIYSAGLGQRDTTGQIVVGGIQSVYDKSELLGRFDLLLIDEAHLIPETGDGMYRQLIRKLSEINPDLRVIGLTATSYRTSTGPIAKPDGILNYICFTVGVKPLILQGHLSQLIGRKAHAEISTAGLHVRQGEFVESEVESRMLADDLVSRATCEIVQSCFDRRSVLVFCQTVNHSRQVAAAIRRHVMGICESALDELKPAISGDELASLFDLGPDPLENWQIGIVADWLDDNGHPTTNLRRYINNGLEIVGEIYGDTRPEDRERLVAEFRAGDLKYLVNVNVLTTGFDAPGTDAIAILRATTSPGLLYQMVGRGFRTSPGKVNCLVLDFGDNFERHGPVDEIRAEAKKPRPGDDPVQKDCPDCRTVVSASVRTCPGCGHVWTITPREPTHNGTSSGEPLKKPAVVETRDVIEVTYSVHTKKDAEPETPKTLKVTYKLSYSEYVSEWVCVEHPPGFAKHKANQWWSARCAIPSPETAAEAAVWGQLGLLAIPAQITVETEHGSRFPRIKKAVLGVKPTKPDECRRCKATGAYVLVECQPPHAGQIVCGECGLHKGWAGRDVVEHYGFYAQSQELLLPFAAQEMRPAADLFANIEQYDSQLANTPAELREEEIPF
jgi:DNA repair protein RadD